MKRLFRGIWLGCAAGLALAGQAPDRGVARLDVAVEPTRVSFVLELPLDSVLGFDHAPQTDAEKAQAQAALARLRDAATMFHVDSAAGCTPGKVGIDAPLLGLGRALPATGGERSTGLEASVDFSCRDAARAGYVEVGLFEAFARLLRVDVQTVTRRGQLKATLKRPVTRVPLAR